MGIRSHTARWMARQELGMERVNRLWTVAWRYQGDECRVSSEDLEHLLTPRLLPWQPCCYPDSLATVLPEDSGYRLAAHTGNYRRGREAGVACGNSGWTALEPPAGAERACWRWGQSPIWVENLSTLRSRGDARYDVGRVRFSNKSAHKGPRPTPVVSSL